MAFVIDDKKMYAFFDTLAHGQPSGRLQQLLTRKPAPDKPVFDINSVIDLGKFRNSLLLMYSESEAMEQVLLVDNLQKIFRSVFRIDGLERLLATNYTDIEWSMFLEYDFNKQSSRFYRDHFFHQFRDAYMAFMLIDEWELLSRLEQWLSDTGSVMGKYILSMCEKAPGSGSARKTDLALEILMKSVLISAIFHDLGYPLSYYMRVTEQIQRSMPCHSAISRAQKASFQQIKSALADSLLFRTVPSADIEQKYDGNDHGLLSALCFLFNFYSGGAVFDLAPAERCIIELSARSIYDHTDKYENGRRATFDGNPLSYILRICDDLQEWARFGLVVDDNSNAMLDPETFETVSKSGADARQYGTESKPFLFCKTTGTRYKKVNFTRTCESIEISSGDMPAAIHLKYDLYALLEIASVNFSYAVYREYELEKLKEMLPYQKCFPNVELKYTLSNNVFWLANEIYKNFSAKGRTAIKSENPSINALAESYKAGAAKKIISDMRADIKTQLKRCKWQFLAEPNMPQAWKKIGAPLSTNDYSRYLMESERFLLKYIGLLGFMAAASETAGADN